MIPTIERKFQKDEVRYALEAAHKVSDQALQDYLKSNTEWAKNLRGIKSRKNHRLNELVITN